MLAVVVWKALVGVAVIAGLFTVVAILMFRVRRTHTRRFGGISYWEVLGGRRFPWRRSRK